MNLPRNILGLLTTAVLGTGPAAAFPSAGTTLELHRDQDRAAALEYYLHWEDLSGVAAFEDAVQAFEAGNYAPMPFNSKLGFRAHPVWVRLSIANVDHETHRWITSWDDASAPILDVYVTKDGALISQFGVGARTPGSAQAYRSHHRFANLELPAGETRVVYFRYWSRYVIETHMLVMTPEAFYQAAGSLDAFLGCYFGIAAAMILYNLFLYWQLRSRYYLYYLGFIGSMVLHFATILGFTNLVAGEVWHGFMDYLPTYRILPLAISFLYARFYLETKTRASAFDRVIIAGVAVSIVLMGLTFIPATAAMAGTITDVTMISFCLTGMPVSWRLYRNGHRPALYWMISWICMLATLVLWMLPRFNIVQGSLMITYAPMVGHLLEMVIISLGLGDHIATLIQDKRTAEIKAAEGERNRTLLRVICHDLVNPLTVIRSYADLLQGRLPPRLTVEDAARRIDLAARHQHEIISHVREMDALATGKVKITLNAVDLRDAIDQAVSLLAQRFQEKNITLSQELPDGPLAVVAEARSLTYSVLANLLSNAIKFSPTGNTVTIAAKVQGGRVAVTVADHGIGMPQELADRLFSSSSRTNRPGTNGEKGTGFGMPIVKSYIDHYGGTIAIASQTAATNAEATGTTVTVVLPLAKGIQAAA